MTSHRAKSHRFAIASVSFLVVFLVLFPKGGLKLGPLPITWGYLALGLLVPPLLVVRLLVKSLRLKNTVVLTLALLVPFQLLFLYAGLAYGIANLPFTISTAINLFFLPYTFLVVFPPFLDAVDGRLLAKLFRWCVFIAAVWGILLFVWHPLTGHYIEIPYLTVNAGDYGELERTKHIVRGGAFLKLISTYNNGNLYGVDTLILLPLYNRLEPKLWRRNILRLALLMTLSRTVWMGMVLEQLISVGVDVVRQSRFFPRIMLGRSLRQVVALVATVGFILTGLLFNSSKLSFLLDPTVGGRAGKVGGLFTTTILPSVPLYGFDEILYVSAAQYWGYAGLAAFTLMMFSPLIVLVADRSAWQSPLRRAALKGLVLYIVLAAIDGAYNFIPTQAFYWFVFMIFLCGWPRAHSREAVRKTVAPQPAVQPGSGGLVQA